MLGGAQWLLHCICSHSHLNCSGSPTLDVFCGESCGADHGDEWSSSVVTCKDGLEYGAKAIMAVSGPLV